MVIDYKVGRVSAGLIKTRRVTPMKRSVVLILSLTVAVTCNAAITYNLTADDTSIYVNATLDGTPDSVYGIMTIGSPGVFTAAYLGPQAPDGSSWALEEPPTEAMGAFPATGDEHGIWAITDYSAASAVTVEFYTTYDFADIYFEDSIVVPEPTTIALLGLGALVLRKRRGVKSFNR